MKLDWSVIIGNVIGGSITGVIVSGTLILWRHSFDRFVSKLFPKQNKEKDGKRE